MDKEESKSKYLVLKRGLDVLISSLFIALLALPMLVIWLLVSLTSRGGGIFRQTRIGRGGEPFVCYKFRTMYAYAPPRCPAAQLEDSDALITPIGRLLRRSSLDELPQLFCVLRGDMSLVGPRPMIAEEGEIHARRAELGVYSIRPGITGLSQVCGRNGISDREKAELDAEYLKSISLLTDVRIICRTFEKVIRGEGVSPCLKQKRGGESESSEG